MHSPIADSRLNVSMRLMCLAILGAGTGAVSGWVFRESYNGRLGGIGEFWLPGTIYGLLWLAVSWSGKTMAVRENYRRSWLWTIGFLLGVTLSYTAAYQAAYYAVFYLSSPSMNNLTDEKMMLSGFLGGTLGGLGLACMLGLMFRSFDRWVTRSILTACSALLGVALALWPLHLQFVVRSEENAPREPGIIAFFIIWQSGMAIAIVAMDAAWRRSEAGGGANGGSSSLLTE